MSLKEEDRQIIVQLELEKADTHNKNSYSYTQHLTKMTENPLPQRVSDGEVFAKHLTRHLTKHLTIWVMGDGCWVMGVDGYWVMGDGC